MATNTNTKDCWIQQEEEMSRRHYEDEEDCQCEGDSYFEGEMEMCSKCRFPHSREYARQCIKLNAKAVSHCGGGRWRIEEEHSDDEVRVIHIDDKGKETIYTIGEFFDNEHSRYATDQNPENCPMINDWCDENNVGGAAESEDEDSDDEICRTCNRHEDECETCECPNDAMCKVLCDLGRKPITITLHKEDVDRRDEWSNEKWAKFVEKYHDLFAEMAIETLAACGLEEIVDDCLESE
tara:strand:+ start:493 stop:1206 length:714 start_codon:yes stop_codon:yes gene_type:complete